MKREWIFAPRAEKNRTPNRTNDCRLGANAALKRGVTIEYAVVFMVLVTLFISLVLTLGTHTVKLSDAYAKYTDEKLFLDEIGNAVCSAYQGKDPDAVAAPDLNGLYGERLSSFGFAIEEETRTESVGGTTAKTYTLTVKKGEGVRLTVRFTAKDGVFTLTAYLYGD